MRNLIAPRIPYSKPPSYRILLHILLRHLSQSLHRLTNSETLLSCDLLECCRPQRLGTPIMVQIRNLVFRTSIVVTLLLTGLILFSPLARSQSYLYNRSDFGTGNNPAAVILADFNGDGRLDFAVANSGSNTVSILLGRPDGTFAQKSDYPTGNLPQALVAADFNGDRKLDLAVLDAQGNAVSVLLGNGDGSFQMKIDYSVGTFPVGIVAADFNGAKRVDLAVVNQNDSTV